MEESIENIRKNAIIEIKEKIKKNSKYVHPCGKEFQDDVKKFRFDNGNEYISWMQQNGILNSPARIRDRYYQDMGFKNRQDFENYDARRLGFEDEAERFRECKKEWTRRDNWNRGITEPMEINEKCSVHFGIFTGEYTYKRFLLAIFEYAKWNGGYRDRGIDFICKDPRHEFIDKYPQFKLERNKEYNIQLKVRCLVYAPDSSPRWNFHVDTYNNFAIDRNNIPDYFIFSAWDDRNNLEPLHIWMIHKDEMVRIGRNRINKRVLWNRTGLSIYDSQRSLSEFEKYELKNELKILKKLCEDI